MPVDSISAFLLLLCAIHAEREFLHASESERASQIAHNPPVHLFVHYFSVPLA